MNSLVLFFVSVVIHLQCNDGAKHTAPNAPNRFFYRSLSLPPPASYDNIGRQWRHHTIPLKSSPRLLVHRRCCEVQFRTTLLVQHAQGILCLAKACHGVKSQKQPTTKRAKNMFRMQCSHAHPADVSDPSLGVFI